jgi:hypothetical protein
VKRQNNKRKKYSKSVPKVFEVFHKYHSMLAVLRAESGLNLRRRGSLPIHPLVPSGDGHRDGGGGDNDGYAAAVYDDYLTVDPAAASVAQLCRYFRDNPSSPMVLCS